MNDEPAEWRWADADGVEKPIDEWDLVGSLSNGTLPRYTLVWRVGWADWLPACQVGELASALPADQVEAAVAPKLDATVTEPPAPPLERYKSELTRDAAAKLLGKSKTGPADRQSAPPPPPAAAPLPLSDASSPPAKALASAAASLMGKVGGTSAAPPPPPPPPPTPPPPTPPVRPPIPTLIDMTPLPSTGTLRPPGAVPPPPRGMPPIPRIPEELEAMILGPTVPAQTLGLPTATPLPTVVITEKSESAESSREQPTEPRASPEPLEPPAERGELPSWGDEVDAAGADDAAAPPAAPTPAPPVAAPPPNAMSSLLLLALGGIAVLLAIAVVVLVVARRDPAQTAQPVALGPSAKIVGESAPSGEQAAVCSREKRPKRIAVSIVQGIPPYVSNVPSSPRLAIGIATSKTTAAGLTLDVTTLDAARTFDETGKRPIVGVVPTTSGGKLAFVVDRDVAPIRYARTIDASHPFAVGMTDAGFARVVGGKDPTLIVSGGGDEKMTEIRVASVASTGHAVTFRRGGQAGKVLAGWLALDGSRKSDFTAITSQRYVGTPTVAANDRDVLIAFAARPSDDAYWTVQLAAAKHGEVPREGKPFEIPPGGPGSEAISPVAAGLGQGRWFIQWTEGSTGQRQVRGQVVGSDLSPIGGALPLSAENTNAGQGVVWTQGEHVVSLFLVSKGRGHELWGATLKCP